MWFHRRLVYIHLFPNGNGRHAWIMADAVLTELMQQPAIDWSDGYSVARMNQRRQQYIAALRAADSNDFSLLLEFAGIKTPS